MSPQFVDFNGDGHLDIVAGTFDGSPHVALGTGKGFRQPKQILDRDDQRIVLNQFWNYDTKKWDSTRRCDGAYDVMEGHLTSALAVDFDGDGDLDLLLGDHDAGGYVFLRINEGTGADHAFATKNTLVLAGGQPLRVPGTVATMRLVDWNRDGLWDLACGSMGDAYQTSPGGGVYVYLNTGTEKVPAFGAPLVLIGPSSKQSVDGPERPDSGIYMDFGDADGDGDLDVLVGGYSHWLPKPRQLSAAEQRRVAALKAELEELDAKLDVLGEAVAKATENLDDEAAAKERAKLLKAQGAERSALAKQRTRLQNEHDELEPGPKRVSYTWLYENLGSAPTEGGHR
ncbi:MAG: FG-GAP-like repeat-containing protein [Planctomycetota bacterium]